MRTQIAVGETPHGQAEHGQQREQRHRASVAEAQPGDAGLTDGDRVGDVVQCPGGGDRVMAEPLSGEQAPVGRKADLPQCGQVAQPFADREVPGVVDRGFGSDRSSELVVLLDLGAREVGQRRGGGNAPFPLAPSRTRREPFSSPGSPATIP